MSNCMIDLECLNIEHNEIVLFATKITQYDKMLSLRTCTESVKSTHLYTEDYIFSVLQRAI